MPRIVKSAVYLTIFLAVAATTVAAQVPYEGYYQYLYDDGGDYPNEDTPGWAEEAQGLTHDDQNWFITQKDRLWKIPLTQKLHEIDPRGTNGVMAKSLSDYSGLSAQGYDHLGAPAYFDAHGQRYVLIALEKLVDGVGRDAAVGVFRADNLEYVAHQVLFNKSGEKQDNGPWVAVDPQGTLYSSRETPIDGGAINRWLIAWDKLKTKTLTLTPLSPLTLSTESGTPPQLAISGGAFSPTGQLLYLVSDPPGIQVFDASTGRRVMQSSNGEGHFNFHFSPGEYEEPEGLTIWDLDGSGAPGAAGQLHVLMLDNDRGDDDVFIEHYTNKIRVDVHHQGPDPTNDGKYGTPSYPFKSLADACKAAWDGAEIRLQSGSYEESLILSKRIRLVAEKGAVVIGH